MKQSFRWQILCCTLATAVGCIAASLVPAAEPTTDAPLPPEEAAGSMVVPPGFEVTLFAGEPDVRQPIGFCIDDRGRLWVAENYNYPNHGTRPGDRILIFADTDGDGRFDERTVFYDQLNYVSGIEVGFGGVWVMSPPFFYFIPDRDGDDRPDSDPVVVLDGFGNHANAHNMANGLAWGPDGWLYGTHGRTNWSMIGRPGAAEEERVRFDGGVYRYHPTRHVWEPYADGTTNPWGIDWDDYGNAFVCNCVNPHLFQVIPGAHYEPWRNRKSSEFAYERIPTIADHLHFTGTGNVRDGLGSAEEDAAGGGHAHCGTLIYLGDSWPDRYRNTLLTNNIHGRRINNDILQRAGSGYVASHGPDLMRSRDPWFMGVTLQCGPDGSVYVSDWSDTGECHSVRNTRRETGRIYRISYGSPRQVNVDVAQLSNRELVQLQLHRNDWFVRHARRVLQERSAAGHEMRDVHSQLRLMFAAEPEVPRKLRALWALHVTGGLDEPFLIEQLDHPVENVRAWAIQLLCEGRRQGRPDDPLVIGDLSTAGVWPAAAAERMQDLATAGDAPMVRLALASALQRIDGTNRWPVAEALAKRGEDRHDSNLPLMNWYAIEPLVHVDLKRFVRLAATAEIPVIRRHIARRAASLNPELGGLDELVEVLQATDSETRQIDLLDGILQGLEGRRRVDMPHRWSAAYAHLLSSESQQVQQRVIRLALIFDDPVALRQLRAQVVDAAAMPVDRIRAIRALTAKHDDALAGMLLPLVSDTNVQASVLEALAEYDHPATPQTILRHYESMKPTVRETALETLAARPAWARQLLAAVAEGRVPRKDLSAYTARQIQSLGDEELNAHLTRIWGAVRKTPTDRAREIATYRRQLTPAVMADADPAAGRAVFNKLCSNCHRLFESGGSIGPDLTGAQRTNLDYVLENLIDPSAAVAKDFQMEIVQTESGRVITGLVIADNETALTIQTAKERIVVPAAEIAERRTSGVSMMPDGQLNQLTFSEVRDLIAYLASPQQIELPSE